MNRDSSKKIDTKGVNILKGDPKTAIRKLSIPLIISTLIVSMYNLIDSIWIAGWGADALTAIGFVIPLQFIVLGIGMGLGSGISAVISRYIGVDNQAMADNAAIHSVIISIISSIVITVLLLLFLKPLLIILGSTGTNLELAINFSNIYFAGSVFIILSNAFYGMLRSEGDVNRTMYAMMICALLNIVLDPIFIYVFDWGMKGAAYATLLSFLIVLLVIIYWIYIKKDTYLKPVYNNFKYNTKIIKDILNVGLPASVEYLVMAILGAIMNIVILIVANSDAVAVYETGWRVITFGIEPIIGISTALVSVVGVNYGACLFKNIKIAHSYAVLLASIVGIISAIFIFVFAPYIAYFFAYSLTSTRLLKPMTIFLQFFAFTFLTFPIGIVSTYLFQGFGKGILSLFMTIIREVICALIFAYFFAVILNMGINGIWLGNVVGYTVGAFIAWIFAKIYLIRLIKYNN